MPIIEEGLGALSLLEGLNGGNGQPSNDLNFNISLVRGHRAHSRDIEFNNAGGHLGSYKSRLKTMSCKPH